MAVKDAGAWQLTIYHRGGANAGQVYMRCHMVAQTDHPSTCPAEVAGLECKVWSERAEGRTV
jgi:hypothetical protein